MKTDAEFKRFISDRVTQLRIQHGISEYEMSLALGQSGAYINKIALGKSMPSLEGLRNICKFCDISLSEFFNESLDAPMLYSKVVSAIYDLSEQDVELLKKLIDRLRGETNEE